MRLELPENDIRPRLTYPLYETNLHKFTIWLLRWLFRVFVMDMDVRGLEHFPATGAAVVACNHLVTFDVFPLQLSLSRMIFYMGKAELFQIAPLHWLFRRLGGFPVYRGERDQWAMEHARKIIAAGEIVAMFPEGTRSMGRGLAVARPGAAKLAIEMQVPLVVIAVNGVQDLFKHFPRRTCVQVTIAPPIYPSADDSPLVLTDKIMFTMAANLPAELRGVYADEVGQA